nr:MAG TPA: hypothetical protein [Caudoviricetes sp.]
MVCVFDVANTFINIGANAPEPITNMKLQKLLYYAQGWYLATTNNELFPEDFEHWTYGPVCAEIYQAFRQYGSNPITVPANIGTIITEGELFDFINAIWNMYGHLNGLELSLQTHKEDPWNSTDKFEIIKKDVMKAFFKTELKNLVGA